MQEKIEFDGDDEPTLEIPPPMKPILKSSVIGKSNCNTKSKEQETSIEDGMSSININSTDDLAEIEKIVKEKMVSN